MDYVVVQDTPFDQAGRATFTVYWTAPNTPFRAARCPVDGEPVGFRRSQVQSATSASLLRALGHTVTEARTHEEARRLAWPRMTEDEVRRGTAHLRYVLEETAVFGAARANVEAALAWLARYSASRSAA